MKKKHRNYINQQILTNPSNKRYNRNQLTGVRPTRSQWRWNYLPCSFLPSSFRWFYHFFPCFVQNSPPTEYSPLHHTLDRSRRYGPSQPIQRGEPYHVTAHTARRCVPFEDRVKLTRLFDWTRRLLAFPAIHREVKWCVYYYSQARGVQWRKMEFEGEGTGEKKSPQLEATHRARRRKPGKGRKNHVRFSDVCSLGSVNTLGRLTNQEAELARSGKQANALPLGSVAVGESIPRGSRQSATGCTLECGDSGQVNGAISLPLGVLRLGGERRDGWERWRRGDAFARLEVEGCWETFWVQVAESRFDRAYIYGCCYTRECSRRNEYFWGIWWCRWVVWRLWIYLPNATKCCY